MLCQEGAHSGRHHHFIKAWSICPWGLSQVLHSPCSRPPLGDPAGGAPLREGTEHNLGALRRGAPARVAWLQQALGSWEAQEGGPSPPGPAYGFVILLPLEQEWRALPSPSLGVLHCEVTEVSPLGKKRPL